MSNFDKANLIIGDLFNRGVTARHLIIEALDDAGLLMPDLPEPGQVLKDIRGRISEWFPMCVNGHDPVIRTRAGWKGVVLEVEEDSFSPDEARALAYALLAAANHTEEEQKP